MLASRADYVGESLQLAIDAENLRARLAAEILASSAYRSTRERVRAFVRQGGGCRATFFNYRRRLGAPEPHGEGGLGSAQGERMAEGEG
jgi:hypothetical protein